MEKEPVKNLLERLLLTAIVVKSNQKVIGTRTIIRRYNANFCRKRRKNKV